jgi:hypothetical protein
LISTFLRSLHSPFMGLLTLTKEIIGFFIMIKSKKVWIAETDSLCFASFLGMPETFNVQSIDMALYGSLVTFCFAELQCKVTDTTCMYSCWLVVMSPGHRLLNFFVPRHGFGRSNSSVSLISAYIQMPLQMKCQSFSVTLITLLLSLRQLLDWIHPCIICQKVHQFFLTCQLTTW